VLPNVHRGDHDRQRHRDFGRDDLLELLPKGVVAAEIGVWRGDFSARILGVTRPTRLHLIDPWRFEGDRRYRRSWYGGAVARSQADMDAIYESVVQRFASEIEEGRVVPHRAASTEAALDFADAYFDWVYLDANHLYEFVSQDLDAFSEKVRRGGLLTGDDYGKRGWWKNGVKRAVDEFVGSSNWEAVHLGSQFVLRKL
jgi:hypothetical protein